MRNPALPFLLLLWAAGCRPSAAPAAEPAFYHWRSSAEFSPAQRAYLDSLGAGHLYLRLMDLDWPEGASSPAPVSVVALDTAQPLPLPWTGVVFITNRAMLRLSEGGVEELAANLARKVRRLCGPLRPAGLQLDCDWSEQSRAKYFRLLKALRQAWGEPLSLSATIRLHQVKYASRTGVPPVDRGMLMFYNMGDLRDPATENSIFDAAAAEKYLYGFDGYPLPLDVALPAFSWGVLLRQGRPVHLFHGLRESDLLGLAPGRLRREAENRFVAQEASFLQGQALYPGDQLRLERSGPPQLFEAARMLAPHLPPAKRHIAFYHLCPETPEEYPYETLQAVCRLFD
jgi:hypothetical protein